LSAKQIRCTSVEETQLDAGTEIDRFLRDEILRSSLFVAVLSPNSLCSTYVLFELGARWGAGKKIFPILIPGMNIDQLEGPLKRIHVIECNRASLWKLIGKIGEMLEIEPENPESVQSALEEVLEEKPSDLEPLAYAVLSYVLDQNNNFALLKDSHYEKIQPPGRRLYMGEQPHEVALSIASKELDLSIEELKRFPPFKETRYKTTRVVPPPLQVQLEKNPHRQALAHYDFVYVFTIDRDAPTLDVRTSAEHKLDPEWYSLKEVESRQGDRRWGPHDDMVDTMRHILSKFNR
ncbi:MAG: toll/interleukin-1 receptor domain-containing protein, partial [Desulfobacteraceae bacterium]|nr:toll/interleukin-1 receptor domain-containing protein [Desulfobacteraceae bacterium]